MDKKENVDLRLESESIRLTESATPSEVVCVDQELFQERTISSDKGILYKLLSPIGAGGMGVVYRAKIEGQDGSFAVKIVNPQLINDATALKRFQQEVKAASELTHANLAAVYDYGRDDSAPFLVMHYVDGISLQTLLKKENSFQSGRALEIFVQVAEALEHAHSKGVLHRDVKPSNIIITKPAKENNLDSVKLIDFGIAKILSTPVKHENSLTQTAQIVGTPSYMSPEQAQGLKLDERSDVYSFGCLMYEVVSGKRAFEGNNPIHIIFKQVNEPPPELNFREPSSKLNNGLKTVVLGALQKNPKLRYQCMKELKNDLERLRSSRSAIGPASLRKRKTGTQALVAAATCAIGFLTFQAYSILVAQQTVEADRSPFRRPFCSGFSPSQLPIVYAPVPDETRLTSQAEGGIVIKDKEDKILYQSSLSNYSEALADAARRQISLRNANFQKVAFKVAQLENLDLQGANFKLCSFRGVTFTHTNLSSARFEDCSFIHFSMIDCIAKSSIFSMSMLEAVEMRDCDLERAAFDSLWTDGYVGRAGSSPFGLKITSSNLNGASILTSKLQSSTFDGKMTNVRFNSSLDGGSISSDDMSGSDFTGSTFSNKVSLFATRSDSVSLKDVQLYNSKAKSSFVHRVLTPKECRVCTVIAQSCLHPMFRQPREQRCRFHPTGPVAFAPHPSELSLVVSVV